MSKAKEKLIEFMKMKQRFLDKYNTPKVDYFRAGDEKLLNGIDDITILEFFHTMESEPSVFLFKSTACIFCKINLDCTDCAYGKKKGRCALRDSTFSNIMPSILYNTHLFTDGYIIVDTSDIEIHKDDLK